MNTTRALEICTRTHAARFCFRLLAVACAAGTAHAAEVSIRFGTIEVEPLKVERTAPLAGARAAPIRGAFTALLITPDGTVPPAELEKARNAAQTVNEMIVSAAKLKYGADIPLTHEVLAVASANASVQRKRLADEGYTFVQRSEVSAGEKKILVETYGRKDFAPEDVIGEATATLNLMALPKISADGSLRLNLTAKPGGARANPSATNTADAAAVQAALKRFEADATLQAMASFVAVNQRAWVLTSRDREQIIEGATMVKKAVPVSVFGQSVRVKLIIHAKLVVTGESAPDPSWDMSL